MKKLLLVSLIGLSFNAIAQTGKYEFAADLGLYTLYTNHGQNTSISRSDGDATTSGTKPNIGLSFTNNIDNESALRFSLNVLNTNPRKVLYQEYIGYDEDTDSDIYETREQKKTFESSLFDVDFINKYQLGKTTLGLVAGVRYAETQWNSRRTGNSAYGGNKFSGFGPSLGLIFNRPLNDRLSATAETKYSHLFGKTRAETNTSRSGSTSSIFEAQVGIQYLQKLQANRSIAYGLSYKYTNFMRLSNLVQHIDPEDTDYSVAGPKLSIRYMFD